MKAKTFLETYSIKYENITISELDGMIVPKFDIDGQEVISFYPSQLINLLHIQTNE